MDQPPKYSEQSYRENKNPQPARYVRKPIDLPDVAIPPFLPSYASRDYTKLSRWDYRVLLPRHKKTNIAEDADAAHARSEAVTTAIENAIEIAFTAADAGDVNKTAVRETSKSIGLVLRAVCNIPPACFCQTTLNMFLSALSKLSTSRATDLAAGMPWERALMLSQNTTRVVLDRLSSDVGRRYKVDLGKVEVNIAFMGFMGPLHHISPSYAPALAKALNDVFSCALHGFVNTGHGQMCEMVYRYYTYADHFAGKKLATIS